MDNSYLSFTGTVNVTNGEVFTVTHDDGASFYVNGVAHPRNQRRSDSADSGYHHVHRPDPE